MYPYMTLADETEMLKKGKFSLSEADYGKSISGLTIVFFFLTSLLSLSQKRKHQDKMTHAPAHHKQVEDLMGAKVFMFLVKDRKLQSIDQSANGVDDPASQKPSELGV